MNKVEILKFLVKLDPERHRITKKDKKNFDLGPMAFKINALPLTYRADVKKEQGASYIILMLEEFCKKKGLN